MVRTINKPNLESWVKMSSLLEPFDFYIKIEWFLNALSRHPLQDNSLEINFAVIAITLSDCLTCSFTVRLREMLK